VILTANQPAVDAKKHGILLSSYITSWGGLFYLEAIGTWSKQFAHQPSATKWDRWYGKIVVEIIVDAEAIKLGKWKYKQFSEPVRKANQRIELLGGAEKITLWINLNTASCVGPLRTRV